MRIKLLCLSLTLLLGGCAARNPSPTQVANVQPKTAYETAAKIGYDLQAAIHQSAQTADQLRTAGTITAAEERTVERFLLSATTFNGNFEQCVEQMHLQASAAAGYLGCANTLATAVKDPKYLATLQVVNPKSQQTFVQWATFFQNIVSGGINALTTLQSGGN